MSWQERSEKLELIDLGPQHYTQEEYDICLEQLDWVGEYLGGDRASFHALNQLNFSPTSILDVGCGGGGFTKKLGAKYDTCAVKGIDISSAAIDFAIRQNHLENVEFERKYLEEMPSKSYDIVIATLVCHHLKDEDLALFLKECLRVAKKRVVINDLHRHRVAYGAFWLVATLCFRNRLIVQDGCLSVKRSFVRRDWEEYSKALNCRTSITWHFPFRWIVTMEPM